MTHHPRPTSALEALDAHLALVARDLEPWLALFADDAVVEFPYAAGTGLPARFEGKDAIRAYYARASEVFRNFAFRDVRRYAALDPNVAIAEAHGSATIMAPGTATGAATIMAPGAATGTATGTATPVPYEQDYVFIVECRDGRIVRYREYWNPLAVQGSFGGLDRVSDALGVG